MISKPTTPEVQQSMNVISAFIKEEPLDKFISESDMSSASAFHDATDEELFELGDIGLDANFAEEFNGERFVNIFWAELWRFLCRISYIF